jgi:hypothetical protein
LFKTPGIVTWLTCSRICKRSPTAIFIGVECITSAPASNDLPIGLNSQFRRAILSQVSFATSNATISFAINRRNNYRQIITIHKAKIVEINIITESEFGNGVGRVAWTCAIQGGATATSLACSSAGLVKITTGACPYPATPSDRGIVDGGLAWFESKTFTTIAVTFGYYSRPYHLFAVIN